MLRQLVLAAVALLFRQHQLATAQLTPDEAMAKARAAAVAKGINPALVQEIGAPVDGEYDKNQDGKRCSGCMASMIELHEQLSKVADKPFNLIGGADSKKIKEIPLLEAIGRACDAAVKTYGYGRLDGLEGYFHKRQSIVRTTSEKMSEQLAQMCNRLAEDADRNSLLLDAHLKHRKELAWNTCVELNKNEPVSEFFSGSMCSESEAAQWIEILMPETKLPPRGDDDVKLDLQSFKARYATRLGQLEKTTTAAGKAITAEELFVDADADGNGRLSRAEIAIPRIRAILNPKTVDKAMFKQKFKSMRFKGGISAGKLFQILDEDSNELIDLEEMQQLHDHMEL